MTVLTCNVRCALSTFGGSPAAGVKIVAEPQGIDAVSGAVLLPLPVVGVTDMSGECVLTLHRSVLGALRTRYTLRIGRGTGQGFVSFTIEVPDMLEADLERCIVDPLVILDPPVDVPNDPPPVPLIDQLIAEASAEATAGGFNVWAVLPSLAGSFIDDLGLLPVMLGSQLGSVVNLRSGGPSISQATADSRPTVEELSTGQPGAMFPDAAKHLVLPGGTGPEGEFIAVCRIDGTSWPAGIIGNKSTGPTDAGAVLRAGALTAGVGYQLMVADATGNTGVEVVATLGSVDVVSARWTATGSAMRLNGGADVTAAHTRNATRSAPLVFGRHRQSVVQAGLQGAGLLLAQSDTTMTESARRAVERLGAFLAKRELIYDQAPTLDSLIPFRESATVYRNIPYSPRSWGEDTAGGATWYAVMDVYLPNGTPPPGGWPPVMFAHPNGQTLYIADGSSTAEKIRDPLLAAGFAVISIEFAHPVASRVGLGASYIDAYNDIGQAVQKIRSLGAALSLNTAKIGAVTRSRGSLALYSALLPDRRKTVGTHQEKQSSLLSCLWIVNGQTVHRGATFASRFVQPADQAAFLSINPDDPALLDSVEMVAEAPQLPAVHLVNNSNYYGTPQSLAVVQANFVHYPDMMLAVKQAYSLAGAASKATDAPGSVDGTEFNGLVAWMQGKLL